jgi:hypothetical protein
MKFERYISWFSGLLRYVVWWLDTTVSEDSAASKFRNPGILKMKAARSSETVVSNHHTTRRQQSIKSWITKAVWKVRGLTLLLPVGTLLKCGDSLFFKVPPLASDALLTTHDPLLENVLQTVDHFEISCFWAPFSWLEKPRNSMGRYPDCMADVLMESHRSTFSKPNTEFNSDLAPCDFWASPIIKRELRGKKFRSDQRSAARFREVGGAL